VKCARHGKTKTGSVKPACSLCGSERQAAYMYGITTEAYRTLKKTKLCEICNKKLSWNNATGSEIKNTDWGVVDHNHRTGKVRGILCGGCNLMLGFAKSNQRILRNASEYLKGTNVKRK